ncbi:OmpA/MotB family protein [Thiomicrorhabdus sediminis]|uniref:Cell envelope biogenesis protein OmpA n=1 Tax=Thiomicrorhabdus sediminis TaxID=2580412 RepID=A0A4P9K661_9GAMM|nr:flagellar motor protein MotB [Thiomicrorhabdus sediminis]QCU90515.1 cell envelope biogenesis protein OmpA [Thiomicrorhabdus sediminis]
MVKRNKGSGGAPWLATFADLMSLLMALFVLLFAMSTIDVPKYKAIVESLTEALGHGSELTPEQRQFFQSLEKSDIAIIEKIQPKTEQVKTDNIAQQSLKPLYEQLQSLYQQADQNSEIRISYNAEENRIQLVFPEQIAFDSGSAELKSHFIELLQKLYRFRDQQIALQVLGHTDSQPIYGGRFHSNWELSSARAASVIEQLIADHVIRPDQAQAIGLADTRPVDKADTAQAYAKNRRVEILITPDSFMP